MTKRVEKLFAWALLLIFAGVIIHTPVTVWLSSLAPQHELIFKSWKEVLMFLLVPVALWLVTKHKLWHEFAKDWIFRLIITYALLHFMSLALDWPGFAQALAGVGIDLRYVLFFGLVYTLIRIAPRYKDIFIKTAIGGALVVAGFATLQLALPADILSHIGYSDQTIKPYQTVDENPDYIRVNSTLRGPNPVGAYTAALLIFVVAFVATRQARLRELTSRALAMLLAGCGAIGLWLSHSRSSWLAAVAGVGLVTFLIGSKRFSKNTWIVVGAVAVIAVGGLFVARDSQFVQNVILHDNPTTGGAITSNDDHATSLQVGFSRLIEQPFGGGVGSTGSASLHGNSGIIIENQYLFIAHETGWIGLLLYLGIFGLVLWRLFKNRRDWLALGALASGIALAAIGVLLPVWADDTVSIVWWSLAALAIGGTHAKSRTRK